MEVIPPLPRLRRHLNLCDLPVARSTASAYASVMSDTHAPWPIEIRLKRDRQMLVVAFDDGVVRDLPAELLRVLSPSAEVQGHSPEQRVTIGGKRDVRIVAVDPVGNYAVKLTFDDGHNTGLFTWAYLRRLGDEQGELWAQYEQELAAKGLRREAR